jgi:hypothetical protein
VLDWEPAVEADLSRAIERVAQSAKPGKTTPVAAPTDTVALEQVKSIVPNLASVSIEEGTQMLREQALKEFQAATSEMETKVKEAQQQLVQAQNGGSDADQQAARKNLLQLQADQMEKLKQIAAKSQAQIQALQQLKSGH